MLAAFGFGLVHLVRLFAAHVLAVAATAPVDFVVPFQVDLNRASLMELATLPGVGESRAAAIVLHRVRNGPFRRVEDLDAVEGFGSALVAQIRPHVLLSASSQ